MALIDEIARAWRDGDSLDELLSQFVVETESRASGIWRLVDGFLELAGFGWAADMPHEVSQGFQDATRRLSLDNIGLGIVKAAVTEKPVVGRRDFRATGLDGSASWIVRFEANSSLAVPIHDEQSRSVPGVVAISTGAVIQENDPLWSTMLQLAKEMGRAAT
jgi:hypothetical protein